MRSEGRGEQLFLFDIKEAIERIRDFTREGQAEFHDSFVIQDAVVKNLLVIGEAARRLSGTAVEKAPEISWSHIVRLRHVLIHGYYKIDLDVVWEVVKHDLDPLYEAVSRMLEDNQRRGAKTKNDIRNFGRIYRGGHDPSSSFSGQPPG